MSSSRKTVLWVDDEIEFLRAHILFLETRGYSVIPVFSGDDALALLREKPKEYDIVLLDEQMPGKDGLTTLGEIKDMLPDLPVVMVTKSEEEQLMDDALGKKIDGYLTKPVNPSQILSVCKRILDSAQILTTHIAQKYSREYTQIRLAIPGIKDFKGFVGLYNSLIKWDFELDQTVDEGLRQTHAGWKSDCDHRFSEFVIENYGLWMRGMANPPLLSYGVLDRFIAPRIQANKTVVLVVINSMRLDHYCALESFLRNDFMIERYHYTSIIPSSTNYARASLFSGLSPLELSKKSPELFANIVLNGSDVRSLHKELLLEKMRGYGVNPESEFFYLDASENTEIPASFATGELLSGKKAGAIVVDVIDHLASTGTDTDLLREMAPDENAFRSIMRSWFEHSTLRQMLKSLAKQECTVVLTSDHGCNLCSRKTEVYGTKDLTNSQRYKVGSRITCDDRHAVQVTNPLLYGLPAESEDTSLIVARENYYFSAPDKFENFSRTYKSSFQSGGISMGELILPISILEPK